MRRRSRLLVQRGVYDEVVESIEKQVQATPVNDPMKEGDHLGPVVNKKQFEHIQGLIQVGIDEGARLVTGGPGLPEGFNRGYYIKPTVFADVTNDMAIATEEVFGPVLTILPFETEDEAVKIANDSVYGLSAYIQSTDPDTAFVEHCGGDASPKELNEAQIRHWLAQEHRRGLAPNTLAAPPIRIAGIPSVGRQGAR